MKLLAIDTATEACSACMYAEGAVYERCELAPQRHTELILPMIEAVLAAAALTLADVDGLAFGRGPGSFTGVRIAAGVIQGIALGTGLHVAAISSLAALAHGCARERNARRVIAAIDARIGEVYVGAFETNASGSVQPLIAEVVCAPSAVPLPPGNGWTGTGSGFAAHGPLLRERLGGAIDTIVPDRYPRAHDVALLALEVFRRGEAVPAEQALPAYLRDRVTDTGRTQ